MTGKRAMDSLNTCVFVFFLQDTSLNELYQMEKDTRVAVMLIRSEFLPVVSSKLLVYKNFKHVITEKKIFLQHEYEEFDNVAKLIAFRILSLFCSSIESVIHAFTIALCEKIMTDDPTKMLTAKQIKDLCSGVFQRTGYGPFGSNRRGRYKNSFIFFNEKKTCIKRKRKILNK